jgi:hypothetical protein
MKHRSIVKKISKLIHNKKKIGKNTKIVHIYSHIEDKMKNGDEESRKKW